MKKWKVLLVMLCAMLVSIGLFACNKGGSDSDIANITRITGASNLSYTDSDKWENVVSDLQKKVTLTCKPAKGDNVTVAGTACEFTSTISFDGEGHCEIGYYTIKITPKENNPKNVSREVDVQITHDFATQGGREVCNYCAATRTFAEEDTIIHYGGFHKHGSTFNGVPETVHNNDGSNGKAFYNKNAEASKTTYIEQFGTVKTVKGVEYTMPTLTVGRLEPGMTITVKGTAQSRYGGAWSSVDDGDSKEDKGYFFPVIGFADRNLNNPAWDGGEPRTDYVGGGTSVLVRGEGWVLYNGMDSSHAGGSVVRMLSGLGGQNSGSGTGRNYGSHELASHESTEKVPDSFTQGQIPAVENWNDWIVYSTGTTSASGVYGENTQIELCWNYRQDGVIELSYNVNGSKLLSMIKVPSSSTGYYDTILHGDYVDMHITSYERIETRTPKEFNISVSKDNYYEGQAFNPATVSATFKFEQTGESVFPQPLELSNFYATTDAEIGDETQWVSLAANKVSAAYNHYKVEVIRGGVTWSKTFAKDQINVVLNKIESAAGASVGAFANNNAVGSFTLGTDGTNITLTPVGEIYVQTIPAGQSFTGTVTDAHKYVAVKLAGTFGNLTSVKYEDGTEVPYIYDQANGTLVLALSKTGKVVVEGLQETKAIFDFSGAKGFDIAATIEIDTTGDGWKLNNSENIVTVTFKAAEGKELGRLYVDNGRVNLAQLTDMTQNLVRDGFTVLKDGTSYQDGLLTAKIAFGAANLANYAARTIEIEVSDEENSYIEFAYRLEYYPEFAANDTVDAGYYSFVSDNKLYLAKTAESEENFTLNLNEGNDNVALLNLAYNYADGNVAFKNESALKGVVASVLDINGGKIVLIEIDPSQYNISATTFGYQFKTDAYSQYYYAVENDATTRQSISGGSVTVLNEGSCLEQGLAGKLMTAGSVKFVADVATFGGSHQLARLAGDEKCLLCGETASRLRIAALGSITLHDNEFVEISDNYANSGFANVYNGITLRLTAGSNWYWLRNDGFIGDNGYTDPAIGSDIWSSLGDDTRTPNGKLDADGNEIDEDGFKATMKAGAAFRIWAGYQDGTFTVIWRLYKKADANLVTGYGKVYYEFTHKFSNITEDSVQLAFGLDGATNAGNSGNFWVFNAGKIDKDMIETVAGTGLTLAHGNMDGHFATVSATGGNAKETTEAGYVKEVSFTITLKENYTTGNASAVVYSDAAFKTPVAGATATVSGKTIEVKVLLKENEAPSVYYIDLRDDKGSTKQSDIKVDLTAVSTYETKASVNTDHAYILTGGTVTIAYTGLPADMAGAKFSVNGTEQAIAATMTFDGVTATWNSNTLTLTLPAKMTLDAIPAYEVVLSDAAGGAIATSKFNLTNLPASITNGTVVESNSVYVYANGDKLNVYLFGEKATGTDYLAFNANNTATDKDKILPYSLAYSMSGTSVSFNDSNDFIKNSVAATHFELGAFKVSQFVIDLSYFKIGTDAAYVLELVTDKANYGTEYYAVSNARAFDKAENGGTPAQVPVVANSCTAIGSNGYEAKDGQTTLGYFGIVVVPSHTWVQHATDATMFECSVCHAWLASGNVKSKSIPAIAQIGEEGSKQSIVDTGLTVSFEVTAQIVTLPGDDWSSNALVPTGSGIILTLPNIDPWNNTVEAISVASARDKELAAKFKGGNGWPDSNDLKNGATANVFNGTSYLTLVISKENGIQYYRNGVLVIHYAANKTVKDGTAAEYAELFLSLTEKVGLTIGAGVGSAKDALIQRKALTEAEAAARYQLYLQEKDVLPKPHEHVYNETTHRCTECNALDPRYDFPTYTTDTAFTLGTDGTASGGSWTGYTPTTGKVFAVQKGKKLTLTGTMKADTAVIPNSSNTFNENRAGENWFGALISLFSGKAMTAGIFRSDNYVIDGDKLKENEGWQINQSNSSATDWDGFREITKDCTAVIEIDWTNAAQIVVKVIYTKTGDTAKTATQTYTVTPASGKQFNEQYSVEIGFEKCYLSITNVAYASAE